jgi:hypothetical protein
MRLCARDQRLLGRLGEEMTCSDPRLASMMATFARLTAGEPMPDREQLAALTGRTRAALRAIGAAMASFVAWLDRLDSPQVKHAECDSGRHAA